MFITLPTKSGVVNENRTAKIRFAIKRFNLSVNTFIKNKLHYG